MQTPTPVEIDLKFINEWSDKLKVSRVEGLDFLITTLTMIKEKIEPHYNVEDDNEEIKDNDDRNPPAMDWYFVQCVGTWSNGEPHTWEGLLQSDADQAMLDYESHLHAVKDATHKPTLIHLEERRGPI